MDNPGWHALHRADRDSLRSAPQRGPDGHYQPVEQVMPMQEQFIGGFSPVQVPGSPGPPPIPPKDHHMHMHNFRQRGYPGSPPGPPAPPDYSGGDHRSTASSRVSGQSRVSELAGLSAVERSKASRVARMEPPLQFMVGPLLRYDTVDERGVWNGAALIVTADAGSVYEPHPTLTVSWDPDRPLGKSHSRTKGKSFDLGPHPADPHSTPVLDVDPNENGAAHRGPHAHAVQVPGQEIWVYAGNGGTFTFWRFMMQVPLGPKEMKVRYSINRGQDLEFHVPARDQNMRWAAHSCNGFSAGVNPDDFRGPGFQSGYDPVWIDLLTKHNETPFHALVGGGDQLYCDGLTREPELQEWVSGLSPEEKQNYPLTDEVAIAIDRFYFNHYCHAFRSGAFARANSTIPMLNMCDDHGTFDTVRKIDGFGSYPDDLQRSPVFRHIGSRGYFYFLLFQCFINVEVDGLDDKRHCNKSLIIGSDGPYVPFPSHSFLASLGPQTAILLLDCRAERRKDQVCSPAEYQKVFERLSLLPPGVEHLVVQIGIPIAYPRMVFLESALESKFNPLVALGRSGSLGLAGFVNKFNAEAELLDDLNDHWTAKSHKKERNWFIEQMQRFAKAKRVRVTFLSGDVHCAAVGVLKTLVKGKNATAIPPPQDYRYMINVVTSEHKPPGGVISMVSTLATKTHKTMHYADTDESMLPLFVTETNGSNRKQRYIMGQRNWCSVQWDNTTGDLKFDIRVEKAKGLGVTVG
ncbi:hypothetical protein PLICRDRAFT_53502 [Plicaturopsis crispa FD-325 SS-3]|nr:hypothetical protein PLICRDRAFT_53502 [Plicaturopsis crispa FD-325 SS-3]